MNKNGSLDLLAGRKKKFTPQEKTAHTLRTVSLVFLVFYCLFAVALFSFLIWVRQESQGLDQKIASQENRLAQLSETELSQRRLKQKVMALEKIFSQAEPDYHQLIEFLENISPEGVVLTGFEFLANDLVLKGKAAEATGLTDFLTQLREEKTSNFFPEIIVNSVVRQAGGDYQFSFGLKINET